VVVVVVVDVVVLDVGGTMVDVSVGSGSIATGAMVGSPGVWSWVVVQDAASKAKNSKVVRGRDAMGGL
jgi:hypothetical protein